MFPSTSVDMFPITIGVVLILNKFSCECKCCMKAKVNTIINANVMAKVSGGFNYKLTNIKDYSL